MPGWVAVARERSARSRVEVLAPAAASACRLLEASLQLLADAAAPCPDADAWEAAAATMGSSAAAHAAPAPAAAAAAPGTAAAAPAQQLQQLLPPALLPSAAAGAWRSAAQPRRAAAAAEALLQYSLSAACELVCAVEETAAAAGSAGGGGGTTAVPLSLRLSAVSALELVCRSAGQALRLSASAHTAASCGATVPLLVQLCAELLAALQLGGSAGQAGGSSGSGLQQLQLASTASAALCSMVEGLGSPVAAELAACGGGSVLLQLALALQEGSSSAGAGSAAWHGSVLPGLGCAGRPSSGEQLRASTVACSIKMLAGFLQAGASGADLLCPGSALAPRAAASASAFARDCPSSLSLCTEAAPGGQEPQGQQQQQRRERGVEGEWRSSVKWQGGRGRELEAQQQQQPAPPPLSLP